MGKKEEQKAKKQKQKKDEKYADAAMLQDLVKIYYQDMRYMDKEPLTFEEEKQLAKQIKRGDIDARNKLIESQLLYVVNVAQTYRKYGLPFLDVIQAGNEGLVMASEKYDPAEENKEVRFNTYADYWIKKMIRLTLDNNRTIHIPDKVLRLLRRLYDVRKQLTEEKGEEPTVTELAERMKVTEEKAADLLMIESIQPDSLQRPIKGEEDEGMTFGDSIKTADAVNVESDVIEKMSNKKTAEMMEHLKYIYFKDEKMQKLYELHRRGATTKMINAFKEEYGLSDDEVKVLLDEIIVQVKGSREIEDGTAAGEMDFKNLAKEEALLKLLASGETTELVQAHDDFAKIFAGVENEGADLYDYNQFWDMETKVKDEILPFAGSEKEELFLKEINKIQSVAYEKYVIKYLLDHFHLPMDMEDRAACVLKLSPMLKEEYKQCGIRKKSWKSDFIKLLGSPDENRLNELALATRMDIETYLIFRKKVLKCKEYDYMNKQFIYMYLTLKYAAECGQMNYKEAYDQLEMLYGDEKTVMIKKSVMTAMDIDSSQAVGKKLFLDLETANGLKAKYKDQLFKEPIDQLVQIFGMIRNLEAQKIMRSDEEILNEQWKELTVNIKLNETVWIKKHIKTEEEGEDYKLKRSDIYRFLYEDSKVKETKVPGCFLNSAAFRETYIDNNVFSHFDTKAGYKKRNLLLTLIFLNFTYELEEREREEVIDYFERLSFFEYKVWNELSPCGYMMLHSENAYDVFLKLLLSCSEPRKLFRYVWKNRGELIEKCIGEKMTESL